MGQDDNWRREMAKDIGAIRERIARIEGRLAGKEERPYITKEGVNVVRMVARHWRAFATLAGFIALWAKTGAIPAANADQIKHLQEAVAWMAQNW